MVARLLGLAGLLGLLNLGLLALPESTKAQATSGDVGVFAQPAKRPLFRPLSAGEASGLSRGGARVRAVGQAGMRRVAPVNASRRDTSGLVFDSRAGSRKAVPITRGQELGLRFRPDERASSYPQPGAGQARHPSVTPLPSAELQSQFRPTEPRRKPTYEELQSRSQRQSMPPPGLQPMMPYPVLPAPLPPATGWPVW